MESVDFAEKVAVTVFCHVAAPGDVAEASRCSLQRLAPCTPFRAVPALPPAAPHGHSCPHRPGLGSSPGAPGTAPESPRPSCCCPGQPHTGPRGTALAPGWYQQPQSLPCAPWVEVRRGTLPLEVQGQTQTPLSQAVTPQPSLRKPQKLLARGSWVLYTLQGGSCDSHTCGQWRGQRHNPAALRRLWRVAKPFPASRTSSSRYSSGGGTGAGRS